MSTLVLIVIFSIAMSAIALVGGITILVRPQTLERLLLPLVAFAAGSLIGGALFHMIPAAVQEMGNGAGVYVWITAGFVLFLALEQFLHWHHSHHQAPGRPQPLTYLILIADALHNFIGGLFVAASFLVDVRLGIITWLAAAAHEVPQELGDFAILVYGGWSKTRALLYNFLSALTFLVGALVAYAASAQMEVTFLIPFAAGNFLYIGAADLIPEIKVGHDVKTNLVHFFAFVVGLGLLFALRIILPHGH